MFIAPNVRVRFLRNFTSAVYGNVLIGTTAEVRSAEAQKLESMKYAEIIQASPQAIEKPATVEEKPRVQRSNIKRGKAASESDLE